MTKNLDIEGLRSIVGNYDIFYVDLWGVIHNGVKLHGGAIFTLKKLLEINKKSRAGIIAGFIFLIFSCYYVNINKIASNKWGSFYDV